jgi:metal-responsive CopG/Arc/MetJ family transcriptional regulator
MPSVKTAISLDAALFKEADRRARKLRVPRSRVISIALEEYFRRQRGRDITERFNRAYPNGPSKEEQRLQNTMMSQLRKKLEDEKW